MECHFNISDNNSQKDLVYDLSSDPRIHNEWIANFRKCYADLTKQIDDLQMSSDVMDDNNERSKKVINSKNKKGRKRAGISRLNPQSLARTVSSRNKATNTYVPNKEAYFHAKTR